MTDQLKPEPYAGTNRAKVLDLWDKGATASEIVAALEIDWPQVAKALHRYRPDWKGQNLLRQAKREGATP
jgi:hypothetical protein